MAGPIRISILANGRQARAEATRTASAFGGIGKTLGKVGIGVGLGVLTAKAVGFAKSAVDIEAKYSQTMATLQAATGSSAQAMDQLNASAIKLGQDTSFSANDAADAMLELAKAGITTKDILGGGVAGTLTLAAAGGTELGTAATIASNAMNSFNLQGKDMGKIAAALAGGANASTASVESLGQGLAQVGPGARNAGLSLQETVGILSAFDSAGIKGSDAGTSLKTMLTRLIPATDEAGGALESVGLFSEKTGSAFVKANGEFKSATQIAGLLHTHLSKLTAAQRTQALAAIFGSDATRAATVLMNQGAGGLRKYIKATNDQAAAQKMAKARMAGTAGALERLSGSIETAKLRLGQELAPIVQKVADSMGTKLVPAMDGIINGAKELGGALAPALGPLADAFHDLIPDADKAGSIFHDTLVPAVKTLSEIVGGAVSMLNDLPGPIKKIGIEAAIAALVLPRLVGGFTAVSGSITANIAKLQQWRAEMTYTETRAQNVTRMLGRIGTAARGAAGVGGMVALTEGAQTSNGALKTLANIGGGAMLGFSIGGPIGAAVGGTAGALLSLAQNAEHAGDSAQIQVPKFDGLKDSLDGVTAATTEAYKAGIVQNLQANGTLQLLNQYGISSRTAVNAILGEAGARSQVSQAISAERVQREAALQMASKFDSQYKTMNESNSSENQRLQVLQLADSWRKEAASHDQVIATMRKATGTYRADVRAKREEIAATKDYSGLLKRLPRAAQTKIKADGIQPTMRAVVGLSRQYHLTPRQIRTTLRAAGFAGTRREIEQVRRRLEALKATKPNLSPALRSVRQFSLNAKREAMDGGQGVSKNFRTSTAKAKADLGPFRHSVRAGAAAARGDASAGGVQVGSALKSGIIAGFAGTQSILAGQAAAAVSAAVSAARHAADAHSPSRKMAALGRDLGDGLVVGLDERRRHAETAARSLVDGAMNGARTGARGRSAVDFYMSTSTDRRASERARANAGNRASVFHLYDSDGTLLGAMRGIARDEVDAADLMAAEIGRAG